MGIEQKHMPSDGVTVRTGTEEVLTLVKALPPEKRRTIAVELAKRMDAPHELMRFLAWDEIVIAEPVILDCPVLSEDDLCELAATASPAHVARLRQRPHLPHSVLALLDPPKAVEPRLVETLRSRSIDAFRSLFVEIAGTQATAALEALRQGKSEPLVTTCKKAGLSRAAYSSIVLLSDAASTRPPATTMALLEAFESAKAA
ncbi:MAG: hypothetical protein RJB62_2041 [Pseudomonadota bacterium]|jgi:uncharacterized protein (DUF2336 family)